MYRRHILLLFRFLFIFILITGHFARIFEFIILSPLSGEIIFCSLVFSFSHGFHFNCAKIAVQPIDAIYFFGNRKRCDDLFIYALHRMFQTQNAWSKIRFCFSYFICRENEFGCARYDILLLLLLLIQKNGQRIGFSDRQFLLLYIAWFTWWLN